MVMLVTENELLSAAINSEGRLTFTRENGDIIDAGIAVGPAVTDADMATIAADAGSAFAGQLSATNADGVYVAESAKPERALVDSMVEHFAPGHGWGIFSSTAASIADDADDYALGSQSLRFVTKTDNTPGSVQKSGYSLDWTGKQVILWVKVTGATNVTELILYAGDASLANNFSWTIADAGGTEQHVFREDEWMPVVLSFADAGVTGAPNRAAISTLRVRARATNGNSIIVRLGGIGVTAEPKVFPQGVISFTCDDSYASQFNVMRPILDKYGWSATAYSIVEVLGSAGFMTIDQLHTLERSSGWEIGGHAFTSAMHTAGYGDGSTIEDTENDVRKLRRWLLANKFRGADHLAYPKGFFTAESQAVMGKYFATARTVTNRLSETVRPSDRMRLRSLSVTNTIPLSTAKALVDRVKAGKGWGIITIHDLVTTPSVGAQWATADFAALVEYIAAQGIPVMNVSEVTRRLVQPDTVRDASAVVDQATQTMGAIAHAALGNAVGRLNAIRRSDASAGIATASGRANLICFTPAVDMTITKLTAMTSGTAWTGHTLARMGLYTVDDTAVVTLVARTASDATLFVAASTAYQRPLDTAGGFPASYELVAGQRYAVGVVGVGQSTGQILGGSASSVLAQRPPVMGGTIGTGLTDLPTNGTITPTGSFPWAELVG